ncbi:MAG: FKBP-type peptidyl-prolyl cis-trans isomerase [Planctomycetota bacterium]
MGTAKVNKVAKPDEPIALKKLTILRTGAAAKAFDWKAEFAKEGEVAKRMEEWRAALDYEQKAKLADKLGFDLSKAKKTKEGLEYVVTGEGSGKKPTKGQTISAHYTGYLLNGNKFDSSVDRGQPFKTEIGVGKVIRGWDIAFLDMKVGEKRVLIIPPELGYGAQGAGGAIPPNATLLFVVELLGIVE